ncbi:MAG TPA: polysaccharide deacetylase family protein [Thermoleophilaceae bacterium]
MILTFHGVGPVPDHVGGSERSVWIERDLYESILDEVRDRDDVAITFDDGNRSDLDVALPALLDRGMRATFFVLGDRIGAPGYLDAGGVRALAAAGMGVGCHGAAHRPWRSLAGDSLRADVAGGRSAIERALGGPVREASCPFGDYDRRVLGELRRLGFERAYTSDGGWTRERGWLQARNTVTADWGPLRARLEGREPARARAVRSAKRLVKRWR